MNTFKRLDEDTLKVEGVYYTTNFLKKIDVLGPSRFKIDSIKLNGIYYYPFKEDKKITKN